MGYEIKKVIEWLLTPVGASLVLLMSGLLLGWGRRRGLRRALTAAGLVVLLVCSLGNVARVLSASLEHRYHPLLPVAPLVVGHKELSVSDRAPVIGWRCG